MNQEVFCITKKKYEELKLGIIMLERQDVIAQSYGDNDVDDDFNFSE